MFNPQLIAETRNIVMVVGHGSNRLTAPRLLTLNTRLLNKDTLPEYFSLHYSPWKVDPRLQVTYISAVYSSQRKFCQIDDRFRSLRWCNYHFRTSYPSGCAQRGFNILPSLMHLFPRPRFSIRHHILRRLAG